MSLEFLEFGFVVGLLGGILLLLLLSKIVSTLAAPIRKLLLVAMFGAGLYYLYFNGNDTIKSLMDVLNHPHTKTMLSTFQSTLMALLTMVGNLREGEPLS